MAKPTTAKIRLNSEGGSGFFYVTKKNTRTMTEKFSIKKYDPVLRKHVEFKEGKIKWAFRASDCNFLRACSAIFTGFLPKILMS